MATKNFRQECLIGEGGFGRVYKGTLQSTGQVVAVKQLDKHGLHGNKEFQTQVLSLDKLQHPNLVKLIGYCADGDQRLLVYEYFSSVSLQDHLYEHKPSHKHMDWITRMKIAFGAAEGLDYLHDKVNPPVIYRDLKASNVLLDDEFYPRLCDFGLQILSPGAGDSLFLSSRVMDTYGYSAPEYTRGEEVTIKSDVYSFGVVLLELITETEQTPLKTFNFRELAMATKNFRQECLIGEGGFGRVYKGTLQSTGQHASHKHMDWITRMKIAFGAAEGLDYLHDKVNPPVIYRDLKASNVLLDDEFYPRLCDFGLQILSPGWEEVTIKSDVYSFGVVLLELITGRRAIDTTKPNDEQNLVAWAQPIFRDPTRYPDMADPLLRKKFSERGLNQAVAITSMCLQDEPSARPLISDVMVALSFLSMSTDGVPTAVPVSSFRDKSMSIALSRHGSCSYASSVSSSDSEDEEEQEEESRSMKKQDEETKGNDSEDESDSNSEKDQEEEQDSPQLEKARSSSSSSDSGSERRRSIEETNATAQSLKIKYGYSSEEEDNERLSICFLRFDSERNHNDSSNNTSMRVNSLAHDDDDEEEENHETRLEHIHSSKSEVQSIYSDDNTCEGSGDSSLRRIEPEEEDHDSSDQE
ncbi:hypothetical protein Bca52824_036845 [Brassica carinata]|uniref:Protein kinase domain-containing protein n=1 Tax=Brassica carinata TaxID=52824 RepID=A0A8X7S634_BRACI|nr:hypothetical protein Bca52824_036845 [Brassica carinata]